METMIADQETGVYAELDGLDGHAVVRRHAWQPTEVGPDVILATTNADGTSYFLHDANRSVMQATGGNGEALGQCAYAPFGEPLGASPARIGFSSELFDAGTRLAYYNYRHLAPGLGRWLGRDAIEEEGGVNLHAFVRNDPIGSLDHLGLACCNGKEYDSKVSCCIDNVVQAKVTDDAGELCCENKIRTVEIRNERGENIEHPGHSFLYIEDTIVRGFYPRDTKWGVIYDTGSIEDDTKHPYDSSLTYSYRACPVTVAKILQSLYDDINNAPKYNFINLIGNNCSGRVCKWIEDGGLNAPFSSNIPGVKPAWNKGKKSYSPFH